MNEIKHFSLTPAQEALVIAQKYSAPFQKSLNTLGTSYFTNEKFDRELLKKAIRIAYQKQECLNMRLVRSGKKIVQYVAEYEEPSIGELDFSEKTPEEQRKKLESLARRNITKFNKPLSRIYFVRTCDGKEGWYFTVSHLCMDAVAIFAFYTYLQALYTSLKNGTPPPKDPAPYADTVKKELEYTGSDEEKRDEEFWSKYYESKNEPCFASINGNGPLEKQRKKDKDPNARAVARIMFDTRAKHQFCVMPKELVAKCENYCRKNSVSMQALIYAAQLTYLYAVTGIANTAIVATCARRAKLTEKSCGGSRIHFVPYFGQLTPEESFVQAAVNVYADQCSLFKHCNINPTVNISRPNIIYNRSLLAAHASMCITYQPMRLNLSDGKTMEFTWYSNGAAAQALYMTIVDGNGTGELHFYYEYQIKRHTAQEIIKSHNGILKILENAVDDESVTVQQLSDMIK